MEGGEGEPYLRAVASALLVRRELGRREDEFRPLKIARQFQALFGRLGSMFLCRLRTIVEPVYPPLPRIGDDWNPTNSFHSAFPRGCRGCIGLYFPLVFCRKLLFLLETRPRIIDNNC